MQDRELYAKILGIVSPWTISRVDLNLNLGGEVRVWIDYSEEESCSCPTCGAEASIHDRVERSWRHLDTCQYKTIITAQVPRIKCKEHKVQQLPVPWAEKNSRLTLLFERLIIDWLKESSTTAVADNLKLSWKQVDGVMQRAVKRGLKRRKKQTPTRIGIDETSFQKRHEYVTVITDTVGGTVVEVLDDRKKEPLEKALKTFGKTALMNIKSVAMDMHAPFIAAVKECVPEAGAKIAFDKFHVIAHLTKAVNQVRRQEHLDLMENGDESLKGSRYIWITGQENLSDNQAQKLKDIKKIALKTSKAWMHKEIARNLWYFKSKRHALRSWKKWCSDAFKSGIAPIQRAASMVSNHLQGIITAILLKVTNARGESMNNKIQHLKKIAYGFRNRKRFKNAILFHLGGLDLYPRFS